ncbi:methyltransferase [Oryctes borbonicus]|uniref:tRNA (guanine(10)-N(2))-methyltransferase TRMT11 n=1 Tax=Oryctes borbonicus TaxID=1629725 RepID=A0A0T6B965_9SCAR|nr:methyltransferase [Oryctes borbonicus]
MELWSYSETIAGVHKQMKQYPYELIALYMKENQTFKIEVETFCRHFTQREKVEKLEAFSYLPVKGQVKLKGPDVVFQYIEYYGIDPKAPPENPYMVFFGRWITNGLRQLIQDLSLKNRKFIGNTSMDPQLSLLMANQAQIHPGDIILDPFVGSGSLLVAAAHFGGYVLGTDIDYLMLHARTRPSRITQKKREKDESVKANMAQYGLDHKYIDVLVNDFAIQFWKDDIRFDAIITDPPYGIREATEKIGTSKENCTVSEQHLSTHIPAKIVYGLSSLFYDLLAFSAKHLKLGGRLVCWFPIFREDYQEDGLPRNPSLQLVANSEQILNKHTSRRLLTYKKMSEPINKVMEERNHITDFRTRYYDNREETRKERRMKRAMERN